MFGTIFVPIDGSALSLRVLPFARDLARTTSARVVLAYALAPWELPIDLPPQVHGAAAELLSSGIDVRIHVCPPRAGTVGRSLVEAAIEEHAGLILMATHARGAVGRALLGSVTDYVVRRAEVPVFVVTETSTLHWEHERPQRILVPLDGSSRSEGMLVLAVRLAVLTGASLLRLRVAEFQIAVEEQNNEEVSQHVEQLLAETRKYLRGLATHLAEVPANVEVLTAIGSPELAIPEIVRERQIDLVVMSTHGGGVGSALLGNVALRTVQRSLAPVLLMHAPAEITTHQHHQP